MEIIEAIGDNRPEIISLLQSQNLPTADLPQRLDGFFTAIEDGRLVGVIGLQRYGSHGLLRSLVVHPEYRNRAIAERLVSILEAHAAATGITAMYLLTETASAYFSKKGYANLEREIVPTEVQGSSEFSHVCPVSATVMAKLVGAIGITPSSFFLNQTKINVGK